MKPKRIYPGIRPRRYGAERKGKRNGWGGLGIILANWAGVYVAIHRYPDQTDMHPFFIAGGVIVTVVMLAIMRPFGRRQP